MKKTFLYFGGHAPKITSRRFRLGGENNFRTTAYKEDGKTPEEIEAEKKERKKAVDAAEKAWKDCPVDKPENVVKSMGLHAAFLKAQGEEQVKNYEEKMAAIEAAAKEVKEAKDADALKLKEVSERLEATISALDIVQVRMKGGKAPTDQRQRSFNENLGEVIEKHADAIKNFKKGSPELVMEMKAVGDMSIGANFPDAAGLYRDVRGPMIQTPYDRVWLGDLLPSGTSQGTSITYPKENGGEGGVAPWLDPTQDKAQIDYDLTSQSAYFKWLAGTLIIAREMLDDIPFLLSYLQNKMLISLKTAENAFILNGTADANPATGLLAAATAYNGAYTAAVDRVIDSGWGQIVEDTFDFYNPTHTILTPRDSVAIGLNKATGSGEYDLPNGSVAFANGQLQIGGIVGVKTTQIGTGNFLTFDKNATMFVKRMQPEIRMFEDAALAKKNKVMFRIEERATLAIFNNKALVTGTLVGA
jgi:hypothetical protein